MSPLAPREDHAAWMDLAIAQARLCRSTGDVPVGAVVVRDGQVIGAGHNRREADDDPTAHAEVLALRQAGRTLGGWRLDGATLVITLEPCAMCAGAAVAARVESIVFGAFEPKAGACGSVGDLPRDRGALHRPDVYAGVGEEQCAQLLSQFFSDRRN